MEGHSIYTCIQNENFHSFLQNHWAKFLQILHKALIFQMNQNYIPNERQRLHSKGDDNSKIATTKKFVNFDSLLTLFQIIIT